MKIVSTIAITLLLAQASFASCITGVIMSKKGRMMGEFAVEVKNTKGLNYLIKNAEKMSVSERMDTSLPAKITMVDDTLGNIDQADAVVQLNFLGHLVARVDESKFLLNISQGYRDTTNTAAAYSNKEAALANIAIIDTCKKN